MATRDKLMSALRNQGDSFPDDLERTEIPDALGEQEEVVDAQEVIEGRPSGDSGDQIVRSPDPGPPRGQENPFQQQPYQYGPSKNDFFASERAETPEDLQQTPPGSPAPSEMKETGGALKKIGDALGKPGVQKTLAQWGAAIAGPDSFAARLAKPTVDSANARQQAKLSAAAEEGDQALQEAIKNSVNVSSETLDKVRKRRMQQQQQELAERRVDVQEQRAEEMEERTKLQRESQEFQQGMAEEKLSMERASQEFRQRMQEAQTDLQRQRVAMEQLKTNAQVQKMQDLADNRAARLEIRRKNAKKNRQYKQAQIDNMSGAPQQQLSPGDYYQGLRTLSKQAQRRLSDLQAQEQELLKSLNSDFLQQAQQKDPEDRNLAEKNAIETDSTLQGVRERKRQMRKDLQNYNEMIQKGMTRPPDSMRSQQPSQTQPPPAPQDSTQTAPDSSQIQPLSPEEFLQGTKQTPSDTISFPRFPTEQAARDAGYGQGDVVIIDTTKARLH